MKLTKSGAVSPLSRMPSWCAQAALHVWGMFFFCIVTKLQFRSLTVYGKQKKMGQYKRRTFVWHVGGVYWG
jgi:hypothetical protein